MKQYHNVSVMVNKNGKQEKTYKRINIQSTPLSEEWFQSLLEFNKELLPIEDISSIYYPFEFIGREILTKSQGGYIDNLYITKTGYLIIVETKLFRNQESRRKVIGQIFEYAKDVAQWDYNWLENNVLSKLSTDGKRYSKLTDYLIEKKLLNTDNVLKFKEKVKNNLKLGKIMLLIVGDAINDNVADMIHFFNKARVSNFKIAAVELKMFKENNNYLIIPNLIAQTETIYDEEIIDESPRDYSRRSYLQFDEFCENASISWEISKNELAEFLTGFEDYGVSIRFGTTSCFLEIATPSVGIVAFGVKDFSGMIRNSIFTSWCDRVGLEYSVLDQFITDLEDYIITKFDKIENTYKSYLYFNMKKIVSEKEHIYDVFSDFAIKLENILASRK